MEIENLSVQEIYNNIIETCNGFTLPASIHGYISSALLHLEKTDFKKAGLVWEKLRNKNAELVNIIIEYDEKLRPDNLK